MLGWCIQSKMRICTLLVRIHIDTMRHAPMTIAACMMILCRRHARHSTNTRNTNMNTVKSYMILYPNHPLDSNSNRLSSAIINTSTITVPLNIKELSLAKGLWEDSNSSKRCLMLISNRHIYYNKWTMSNHFLNPLSSTRNEFINLRGFN